MKLTERQEKRLKWFEDRMTELLKKEESDSNTKEGKRIVELHDNLVCAYNQGQDTCASCGALFTPDPILGGGECGLCSKHPLAFVQSDLVKGKVCKTGKLELRGGGGSVISGSDEQGTMIRSKYNRQTGYDDFVSGCNCFPPVAQPLKRK